MGEGFDASVFPDAHRVILPSRAYLLSVQRQTVPARRQALEDAEGLFAELGAEEDRSVRDMALLGLVGETMQALEDLAYFARAYERPMLGVPNYVTATVYSQRTPTNFFGSVKNWSHERLLVLAGLRMRDHASGRTLSVLEAFGAEDQFEPRELEAIKEAERATVALLGSYLRRLAKTWNQFGRYFHAYKHAGLAINREDFRLVEDDGTERAPSIAVWRRKGREPVAHGEASSEPEDLAREVLAAGRLALDVTDFVAESRLRFFDQLKIDSDGQLVGLRQPAELWGFWVHERDLPPESRQVLERRFGITFNPFVAQTSR